jgi:hypothetical protein
MLEVSHHSTSHSCRRELIAFCVIPGNLFESAEKLNKSHCPKRDTLVGSTFEVAGSGRGSD